MPYFLQEKPNGGRADEEKEGDLFVWPGVGTCLRVGAVLSQNGPGANLGWAGKDEREREERKERETLTGQGKARGRLRLCVGAVFVGVDGVGRRVLSRRHSLVYPVQTARLFETLDLVLRVEALDSCKRRREREGGVRPHPRSATVWSCSRFSSLLCM